MRPVFILLSAVIAYFLGCFNGSVIVSKYILKNDIRSHGSGNAGLTNFYRVFGGKLTFVVLLTDVLKAVIAVKIGEALISPPVLGIYVAGLFCLIGHMFPCMFHFKGGKGILSGGAGALMLDWRIALTVFGVFFILAFLTKWVSLGSVVGGASFPVATALVYRQQTYTLLSLAIGALIVWKHRENIKRLLRGEESKFTIHRKP